MAKFYGAIGYAETQETAPGVWTEAPIERNYYGDILKNVRRWQNDDSVNGTLTVSNTFSVIADAYAYENFHTIRYIKWMGAAWKVTSVEVQRPRLLLTIGGIYNGEQAAVAEYS